MTRHFHQSYESSTVFVFILVRSTWVLCPSYTQIQAVRIQSRKPVTSRKDRTKLLNYNIHERLLAPRGRTARW